MLNLLFQGMVWGAWSQARMPGARLCLLVPPSLQPKVVLMGCWCWQHHPPCLLSQALCHAPQHSPQGEVSPCPGSAAEVCVQEDACAWPGQWHFEVAVSA